MLYETVVGASILTLPFISNNKGAMNRGDFSLIGERHGRKLNTSKYTTFVTIKGIK